MSETERPGALVASLFGVLECIALLVALAVLLVSGRDSMDQLAGAFVFVVSIPVAVLIGIVLGILFGRSLSPWAFARPRQVIISVCLALLAIGLRALLSSVGASSVPAAASEWTREADRDRLLAGLADADPEQRLMAEEEIVRRGVPGAAERLLPLLDDSVRFVRGRTVTLLAELGARQAVPQIIRRLDDPDFGVRLDAVRALGRLGDTSAVAPLIRILGRTHFGGSTAEALASIGSPQAVGPLVRYVEGAKGDDQLRDRVRVFQSLRKLTGESFGDDARLWRTWYDSSGQHSTDPYQSQQ